MTLLSTGSGAVKGLEVLSSQGILLLILIIIVLVSQIVGVQG